MSTVFRQLPAFLFLIAALVAVWRSLGFPPGPPDAPGPGVVPLWLAVILAVISLILLIRGFRKVASPAAKSDAGTDNLRLALLIAALAVYAFFMPLMGFIVSTTLLSLAALHVFGHRGALHAWAYSLGISFVLYLLFQKLMNVPLPSGWLG
jgi:putative tricarboxylic transport membrane protein